ncbi:MAG TPA: sigma-70 family RNA polymerase sigma factor [Kofleriaceae bacterium]|nr:sigma-70 family RNA polymerase sigma factor [Kofleriaceae bacterium]
MGPASDAELARRIAVARDPDAEAELCRRFAPRIRLYGLKHLRDEDRARDLVQAVLVVVLQAARAGRVEDPDRIDRFVLGTCRNVASRTRQLDARAEPAEPAMLDVETVMPRLEVLDLGALLRCLERVEVRARTVLHLSFYRDKSADEIAQVLELTAGNVRVMRHRAIAQLRDCLGVGA